MKSLDSLPSCVLLLNLFACVGQWHRMWQRGIQMRRNIVAGNFQGWRLFSNTECPVAELLPTRDMNKVKQDLGEFPKLSTNDDLKIDWDDKHLVLFQDKGDSCTIRLWDIQVRFSQTHFPQIFPPPPRFCT